MRDYVYIVKGPRKNGVKEPTISREQLEEIKSSVRAFRGCQYCRANDNDFRTLNAETAQYSFLQIAMNSQGLLRVRDLSPGGGQEVIRISYCPICGEKL